MTEKTCLEQLLVSGSKAIGSKEPGPSEIECLLELPATAELVELLQRRNGFFVFERGLHVRAMSVAPGEGLSIRQWNAPDLWRSEFGELDPQATFFAEDLFGNQFGICDNGIIFWDAETGEEELVAQSLDEWAKMILDEPNYRTGWSLAVEWQQRHRKLETEERLFPKVPFVLGGEYTVENLHPMEAAKGLRFLGSLAVQLSDLPDGASISFEFE